MPTNSEIIARWNEDLRNLDSAELRENLSPQLLQFLGSNCFELYCVEYLPKHLKQLSTCVVKIDEARHILLLSSELKTIADAVRIPLQWMMNIALLHELSHIIADLQNTNHKEESAWDIGSTLLCYAGVDDYTYHKVKNYLLGKQR